MEVLDVCRKQSRRMSQARDRSSGAGVPRRVRSCANKQAGLQLWRRAGQRSGEGQNILSSGAQGVKDPGDGAVAQYVWGLV